MKTFGGGWSTGVEGHIWPARGASQFLRTVAVQCFRAAVSIPAVAYVLDRFRLISRVLNGFRVNQGIRFLNGPTGPSPAIGTKPSVKIQFDASTSCATPEQFVQAYELGVEGEGEDEIYLPDTTNANRGKKFGCDSCR